MATGGDDIVTDLSSESFLRRPFNEKVVIVKKRPPNARTPRTQSTCNLQAMCAIFRLAAGKDTLQAGEWN